MKRKVNVAYAKEHFSEMIGTVTYNKEPIIITKRGKSVARIVPLEENKMRLSHIKGWLAPDDKFFNIIDRIISNRDVHVPRVFGKKI